jgi:hypothetical protein
VVVAVAAVAVAVAVVVAGAVVAVVAVVVVAVVDGCNVLSYSITLRNRFNSSAMLGLRMVVFISRIRARVKFHLHDAFKWITKKHIRTNGAIVCTR